MGLTHLKKTMMHFLQVALFVILFNAVTAVAGENVTLRIGVVPQYSQQEVRFNWDPLLLSIANKLGLRFVFVNSSSIPEFEIKLVSGEFDVAYMNPYHLLEANRVQGYIPIVRDVGRHLRGIVVVRKDSGITNINQLKGRTVAFPAPHALGASLLVRSELFYLHNIQVNPQYVETHSATYLSVLQGKALAGGGVIKTFDQQPDTLKEALRIIYKTEKVATHPIAVHPRVPENLRLNLKNAFLRFGETPSGQAVLARIPIKKIGEASLADYERLNKMNLREFIQQD